MAGRWFRAHDDLIFNTASLVGSAAATSGLGFAFWLVAARLFSSDQIGLASAAVSAMLMLSTLGIVGLDALVIGEIGKRLAVGDRGGARRMVSASMLVALFTSGALGLAFALLAPALSSNYARYFSDGLTSLVFAVGVGLTAATFVFDRAAIGFLRGGVQLGRNVFFAVLKLATLPLLLLSTWSVHRADQAIYALWAVTTAASLLVVLPGAIGRVTRRDLVPDWRGLSRVLPQGVGHMLLNLAQHGPGLAMPVLVIWLFPPAVSAAFYVTWMAIVFAQSVPANLTTTLFAVGARDPGRLATKLAATVRLASMASAAIVVGSLLLAKPLLDLFGPGYSATAAGAFKVLALTVVPLSVKTIYFALARILDFTARASLFGSIAGLAELVAAAVGARSGSLTVMSWCLVTVLTLEALLLTPLIVKHLRAAPALGPAS